MDLRVASRQLIISRKVPRNQRNHTKRVNSSILKIQ